MYKTTYRVVVVLLLGSGHAAVAQTAVRDLVPDIRAGGSETSQVFFTDVIKGAAAADGKGLFVAQHQERIVKLFTAGKGLRTFGRAGNGPGEFMIPGELRVVGRELLVLDNGNRRIEVFDTVGTRRRTVSFSPGSATPMSPVSILADYSFLARSSPLPTPDRPIPPELAVWRVTSTGQTTPLGVLSTAHSRAIIDNSERQRGIQMPEPYGDAPLILSSRDGRSVFWVHREVTATGGEFRIIRVSLDGDTLLNQPYKVDPIRLTDEPFEKTVDSWSGAFVTSGMFQSIAVARQRVAASLYRPRFLPAVKDAITTGDGTIWLQLAVADDRSSVFMVVSLDGKVVGRFRTPEPVRALDVANGYLWATRRDSLDVPLIIRFAPGRER